MSTTTIDKHMQEVIQKKSNGFKKADAAKYATESKVTYLEYDGCFAADAHWKIKVKAGQKFEILADTSVKCDSRGWSCDNWATRSGPEGVPGYFVNGSLGYPNCPIGMLIGAIHRDDVGDMDQQEAQRIFTNNVMAIGARYIGISPIDGWLYLIFNDTWSWSDNKGAVHVNIKLAQ